MRIVSKRWFAIGLAEFANHPLFNCPRNFVGCLAPSNQHVMGIGQLPNQSSTPMPDWLSRSKSCVLLEPSPQVVGFANINNADFIYPVSCECFSRHRRVLAFKPASRAFRQEIWQALTKVVNYIYASRRGAVPVGNVIPTIPSFETNLRKLIA